MMKKDNKQKGLFDPRLDSERGYACPIRADGDRTARYYPTTKMIEIPVQEVTQTVEDYWSFRENLIPQEEITFTHERCHYFCDDTTAMQYIFERNITNCIFLLDIILDYYQGREMEKEDLERDIGMLLATEKFIEEWQISAKVCMETYPMVLNPSKIIASNIKNLDQQENLTDWEKSKKRIGRQFLELESELGRRKAGRLTAMLLRHALNPGILGTEERTRYKDKDLPRLLRPDKRFFDTFSVLCAALQEPPRNEENIFDHTEPFDPFDMAEFLTAMRRISVHESADRTILDGSQADTEKDRESIEAWYRKFATKLESCIGIQIEQIASIQGTPNGIREPLWITVLPEDQPSRMLFHPGLTAQTTAALRSLHVFQQLKSQFINWLLDGQEEPWYCLSASSPLCTGDCADCRFQPLYRGMKHLCADFRDKNGNISNIAAFYHEYRETDFEEISPIEAVTLAQPDQEYANMTAIVEQLHRLKRE